MSIPATEIIIIGGGPALLSAALTFVRVRRRVVVIDSGEPRNAAIAVRASGAALSESLFRERTEE